jgi:succinate dehydrogenase/fumarate reductase flavoprotein subunit
VSYFRSVARLRRARTAVDALWPAVQARPEPGVRGRVRSREAAAMVAAARWMHTASLARVETRGMHVLAEHPEPDPGQRHRLVLAGVDRIALRTEEVPA